MIPAVDKSPENALIHPCRRIERHDLCYSKDPSCCVSALRALFLHVAMRPGGTTALSHRELLSHAASLQVSTSTISFQSTCKAPDRSRKIRCEVRSKALWYRRVGHLAILPVHIEVGSLRQSDHDVKSKRSIRTEEDPLAQGKYSSSHCTSTPPRYPDSKKGEGLLLCAWSNTQVQGQAQPEIPREFVRHRKALCSR